MILIFVGAAENSGARRAAVRGFARTTASRDGLLVHTTTTILGYLASAVAGDVSDVEVLIPIGVDPHDYQPSSRQIALLADADLIVLRTGSISRLVSMMGLS